MTAPREGGVVDGVSSIGVLTASGIGDFLVTVPALTALRAAYPHAELTVLGDTWHPALLDGRPGPWDRAVVVPREDGVCRLTTDHRAPIHAFLAENAGRYDLVVQMHGGGRDSNPVVRALRPAVSVGSWTPDAEPLDRCVPYVPGRPEVLRWLEVAALAGAAPALGTRSLLPTLTVTEGDVAASREAWSGRDRFVLLHVGARDARRCWSPARFATVGRRLRAALDADVLLLGAERDRARSAEVVAGIGDRAVDLTGRVPLGATLGLARRALLFVGNDSGPRHVAAAAGTPTVGIFWVGNVVAFGPLTGGSHRVVVSYTVRCPVCDRSQVESRCGHDVSFVDSVGPDEVLQQCEEVLRWDERP